MNKAFKVIRFIFYALAIVSMVFTLVKKIGHAASGGGSGVPDVRVESFPLPFGDGSNMGYDSSVIVPSEVAQLVIDSPDRVINSSWPLLALTVNEYNPQSNILRVTAWTSLNGSTPYITLTNVNNYPTLEGNILVHADQQYGFEVDLNNNVARWVIFNTSGFSPSNYLSSLPTGGSYLPENTWFYGYPIYMSEGAVLEVDGNEIFTRDLQQSIENGMGEVLEKFDILLDGQQGISDGIGDINDNITRQGNGIISKLEQLRQHITDTFGSFRSWLYDTLIAPLVGWFSWLTQPYNSQEIENYIATLPYSQDINTFRGAINGFTGSWSAVTPSDGSDLVFDIPFQLPYRNTIYHASIDFTWYENIRYLIVPFIMCFLFFGFALSLLRSIPGIFHGNAPDNEQ